MAGPGRPERNNRAARSFRQLRRFHHVINSNKVFGTHTGMKLRPMAKKAPAQLLLASRWSASSTAPADRGYHLVDHRFFTVYAGLVPSSVPFMGWLVPDDESAVPREL